MTRTLLNLLLGTAVAILASPFDAVAGGRGGGYGGGGNRGEYNRGGQMGGSPSFSQPRQPSQNSGGYGNRSAYGNQAGAGAR